VNALLKKSARATFAWRNFRKKQSKEGLKKGKKREKWGVKMSEAK
jgi:hypothetical protein